MATEFDRLWNEVGFQQVAAHHAEPVGYKYSTGVRIDFEAPIDSAEIEDVDKLPGMRGRYKPGSLFVHLPKSEVAVVKEKKEHVYFDGKEYLAALITESTVTAWKVLCLPTGN